LIVRWRREYSHRRLLSQNKPFNVAITGLYAFTGILKIDTMNSLRKNEIRKLLELPDFNRLIEWGCDSRSSLRLLFSLSYDRDELIRWRVIDGIGKISGAIFERGIEMVRDFIRRLMWLMNDESGGLGWHAPEAIGEILVNVPTLIDEYGELLPRFFNEEPFEKGSHFAVYRVASIKPAAFTGSVFLLRLSIDNPDAFIAAHAALALVAIGAKNYITDVEKLRTDNRQFTFYDFDSSSLRKMTVGQAVEKAIKLLNSLNPVRTTKQIISNY
jgi:hypothetical protein